MPHEQLRSRATTAAWKTLERELGRALSLMGEGEWQYLILSDQGTGRYVQFAVKAAEPLRAEALSNDYLPPAEALGKAQVKALVDLGWTPPSRARKPAGKQRAPSNFVRVFDRPVDHGEVAAFAVRTLRDVFQTPFPARLDYHAFEKGGAAVLVPTLEIVRHRPDPAKEKPAATPGLEEARTKVLAAVRKASGDATLELDEDGDLAFRFRSALVIVRLHDDPPYAHVYAPVVTKVEPTPALHERLNELGRELRFARLFELRGTVWASAEVFTSPLVTQHVVNACEIIGELASDLDDVLEKEFGGKPAFEEKRAEAAKQLGDGAPRRTPRPVGFRPP